MRSNKRRDTSLAINVRTFFKKGFGPSKIYPVEGALFSFWIMMSFRTFYHPKQICFPFRDPCYSIEVEQLFYKIPHNRREILISLFFSNSSLCSIRFYNVTECYNLTQCSHNTWAKDMFRSNKIVAVIVKTQRNSTQLNSTQSNCKSNFVWLDIVLTWNPNTPPHPKLFRHF